MKNTHVAQCNHSRLNGEVEGSLTSSSRMLGSIMILAIALALASCGGDSGSNADSDEPVSSSSVKSSSSSKGGSAKSSSSVAISVVDPSTVVVGSITDSRDKKKYKTVKIGSQVWMAENLNYKTENSYCYEDESSNCDKYGRLYTWAAAKKACPSGWHLPTRGEFDTLFESVGGTNIAASKLVSKNGWYMGGGYEDYYLFSALPAGGWYDYRYRNEGYGAYFWSSSQLDTEEPVFCNLSYDQDFSRMLYDDEDNCRVSVRCVKD